MLGPDGFSSSIFKSSWPEIRKRVYEAVQEFFSKGTMLKQWNETRLLLIPKVVPPITVADFRPISCCNVLYKCISKLLCSRLNEVLPKLVNPSQGAFVASRELLFNVLLY